MSTNDTNATIDAARKWMRLDPDTETRDELALLVTGSASGDEKAIAELHDRFDTRLGFGTAGLRGELGAGPNRMNRVLVSQAAAGLAEFVKTRAPQGTIVVGYDARKNSRIFAHDSAEVITAAGLKAILLPRSLPTPVLSFAVRHLNADAGVMVTASHNPGRDNGYKVYLGGPDNGSQIVAPSDAQIAAAIDAVAASDELPARSSDYEIAPESVVEAYIAATANVGAAGEGAEGLRWVYTAMHGVGWEIFQRVLQAAGYPLPKTVDEQLQPDPAFPTVDFPNPEEPGALDLSFERARKSGAELIIAHDPDADRLAVAIPDPLRAGGWRRLTGNDVGLLLAQRAATVHAGDSSAMLAASLVSSPALADVAKNAGVGYAQTPTGFKWISRVPGLVFGYEEALGYLVNPETLRDKDGISAAVAFLQLATNARAEGKRVSDLLTELAGITGAIASAQVSVRFEDLADIANSMARLRETPLSDIGGVAVATADDLLNDAEPVNALRYTLVDGSRIIFRPSGTEPKLKAYIDVRAETESDAAAQVTTLEQAVRALFA